MCVRYEPHGEKTGKTASLKHRINGKQKKESPSDGSEDSKIKKNVRPTDQMEVK